ncbi:MAG TPA: hypothetical protein VJ953_10265 [Saprospiraceae bacterium]|nr:hypothetical protein [Saprospiraceae bacterium]
MAFLSRKPVQYLLVIIVMLGVSFLRFPDFFQHPGHIVEPYGDGFKAYTVIDYHAEYDSTYTHFQGMNYPYGDHAIPSATQPLISNTIKFISDNFIDITDYTIAIVNLSMMLSLVLCGLFLFLIFQKLNLPWWYALAVALGLTFLSPQIHRIHAHYGLSHPEAIPALFYFLLRYDEKPKLRYSFAVALVVLVFSLIHFYYFAILIFAISFFFLFKFLRKLNWRDLPRLAAHYGIQAVLPLLFFVWWLFSKDPIEDRTAEPWGFFNFHALWEGIVLSLDQPYFRWIDRQVIKFRPTYIENRAYIGLVSLVVGMFMLVRGLSPKRTYLRFDNSHGAFLLTAFWSSFVLLIFALGVPFTIGGLEFLLDYAGPVRQFRSVGRFAWIFYFVINIVVFTWLYEQLREKSWRYYLLIPALLILYLEAYYSATSYDLRLDTTEELHGGKNFKSLPGINYEDFQAILTVPYYNIGSDQFWWEPEGFILQKSLTLSIQTGLPVTSAMLTRSSRSQTLKQMQFVTEPYRVPTLLADLPDDRPLLMMLDQLEYEKEKERYAHLLDGAALIYSEGDRLRLYRQPLRAFAERLDQKTRRLNRIIRQDTTLIWQENLATQDRTADYYYEPFADSQAAEIYFGGGAYQGTASELNTFAIPNLGQEAEGDYALSMWVYIADDRRSRAYVQLDEYDAEGNHLRQHRQDMHRLIDLFDSNGWAMLELPFKPASAESTFTLTIQNQRLRGQRILLDELLVRPAGLDIYGRFDEALWWNNRHYFVEE